MRVLFFELALIKLGKRKKGCFGRRKEKGKQEEHSQNDPMQSCVHVLVFPVERMRVNVLKNLRRHVIVHIPFALDRLTDPGGRNLT